MEALHPLAIFGLIAFFSNPIVFSTGVRSSHFTRHIVMENKMFPDGLLQTAQVMEKLNCVFLCNRNKNCNFALYHRISHQCNLYYHDNVNQQTVDQTGWHCWSDLASKSQPELTTKAVLKSDLELDNYSSNVTLDKAFESQPKLTTEAAHNADLEIDSYNPNVTLDQACVEGKLSFVKYILRHSLEDINSRGPAGRTPVMAAAFGGQVAIFDYLVSQGCDLLATNVYSDTVLHIASIADNTEIVEKLIFQANYDINSRGCFRMTPLLCAARSGSKRVFDFLVSKGCDVATVDHVSNNILHLACIGGHLDLVNHILSRNLADKESKGFHRCTALLQSAGAGNKTIVEYLVRMGCNVRAVDGLGNNMLHIACLAGGVDLVKYILSKQLSDIEKRGFEGRTAVMTAAEVGMKELISVLVSYGCNLRATDNQGNTALHSACYGGHFDAVKYLIIFREGMTTMRWKNKYGSTPAMLAKQMGHKTIFYFLENALKKLHK